ncbi:ImmA/IrrE family metallo-endopeptidase [Anaplasmataceae bacterium AB001_6]|nr:ImmA/IrrE family metallo-endopeptidase [Anaplasmataceae bacterium AB001_6]
MEIDVTGKMTKEQKSIFEKYRGEYPFNVIDFAIELGIKMFTCDDLEDDISGYIEKDKATGTFSITVNTKHSLRRNRFTIAHEVGHFFYDDDYLTKNHKIEENPRLNRNTQLLSPQREILANQFAAELLMPSSKFIEIYKKSNTLQEVASFFNVSVEAVTVRAHILLGVM